MKSRKAKLERRSVEVKAAVSFSSKLINRLRKISVYRHWVKRDFVVNQCAHENIIPPSKSDHIAAAEMLKRFALRNDISIVFSKTKAERRAVRKATVRTDYNDVNVFTRWRKVRYEALKRSCGRCECCGNTAKSSGEPLHVDHIKPKSLYPELEFELLNLQVLCADCNIGKGNWDETNWRGIREIEQAEEDLDREHLATVTRIYE